MASWEAWDVVEIKSQGWIEECLIDKIDGCDGVIQIGNDEVTIYRHLTDLDGDRVKALNALKEKDATADLANGADGEAVRIAKDVIGHEGLSSWSDAVELTVRT